MKKLLLPFGFLQFMPWLLLFTKGEYNFIGHIWFPFYEENGALYPLAFVAHLFLIILIFNAFVKFVEDLLQMREYLMPRLSWKSSTAQELMPLIKPLAEFALMLFGAQVCLFVLSRIGITQSLYQGIHLAITVFNWSLIFLLFFLIPNNIDHRLVILFSTYSFFLLLSRKIPWLGLLTVYSTVYREAPLLTTTLKLIITTFLLWLNAYSLKRNALHSIKY